MTTPASIRREVRRVRVKSLANGHLRIEPEYTGEPIEPDAPVLGVLDRMALARWAEDVLNRELEENPEE